MIVTNAFIEMVNEDITRLKNALNSQYVSVQKDTMENIVTSYDFIISGLTNGLKPTEEERLTISYSLRNNTPVRTVRTNTDALRSNLQTLLRRLERFRDNNYENASGERSSFKAQQTAAGTEQTAQKVPEASSSVNMGEFTKFFAANSAPVQAEEKMNDIDRAISQVRKRSDINAVQRGELMSVLTEIKSVYDQGLPVEEKWDRLKSTLHWVSMQNQKTANEVLPLLLQTIS